MKKRCGACCGKSCTRHKQHAGPTLHFCVPAASSCAITALSPIPCSRAALPGLIAPRHVEGETLWDDGLGCSAPIEQWIDDPEVTHIVVHSILHHAQVRARERSDRYSFAGAMLAGHQLTADELLHWKLELARRAGKTVVAVETITPRPRIGVPITFWPPKPWPEHARDLMALGAGSARRVLG